LTAAAAEDLGFAVTGLKTGHYMCEEAREKKRGTWVWPGAPVFFFVGV
jgi:hypothetical protein